MEDDDYITLAFFSYVWMPIRNSTKPFGWEHVVDTRPASEDIVEAKRAAVSWAKNLGLTYRHPI